MSDTRNLSAYFDSLSGIRDYWISRNRFFYESDWKYMRYFIPEGRSVLEIGCGSGQLLNAVQPSQGVGIDFSIGMIERARESYPNLTFIHADAQDAETFNQFDQSFDYIIVSDTLGLFEDCQLAFENMRQVCSADTRIVIGHFGYQWEPLLKLAEVVRLKMPQPDQNWLAPADIKNLLEISGYEVVSQEWSQILPFRWLGLGNLLNKYIGTLPLIRRAAVRNYVIARPIEQIVHDLSASVIVPCRNERGNIESAVTRLPKFCNSLETVFVEGHSQDGTHEECLRVQKEHPDWQIQVLQQPGKGKGDAVRAGFDAATGDVLIILDADLTVPPEQIPKFYQAIASNRGEFINGSRLVYPMEDESMRFLNLLANWTFARIFSFLCNQRLTDTLCGTKVLQKKHYEEIARNRPYFGDLDPFGDFDLIFGSVKLNLKFVEIPVRYASRTYGTTQISRFSHGWLLLKMVGKAYFKIKAI